MDLGFLGEAFLCLGDRSMCLPEDEVREVEAPELKRAGTRGAAGDGTVTPEVPGTGSRGTGSSVPERPSSWLDGTSSRGGGWNRKKETPKINFTQIIFFSRWNVCEFTIKDDQQTTK